MDEVLSFHHDGHKQDEDKPYSGDQDAVSEHSLSGEELEERIVHKILLFLVLLRVSLFVVPSFVLHTNIT